MVNRSTILGLALAMPALADPAAPARQRQDGSALTAAQLEPGANLRGAHLLRDADFKGVDLRAADLRDADLRGLDLRATRLEGADLRGARLEGARLPDGLLLNGQVRLGDTQGPDGTLLEPRPAAAAARAGAAPAQEPEFVGSDLNALLGPGPAGEVRQIMLPDGWPAPQKLAPFGDGVAFTSSGHRAIHGYTRAGWFRWHWEHQPTALGPDRNQGIWFADEAHRVLGRLKPAEGLPDDWVEQPLDLAGQQVVAYQWAWPYALLRTRSGLVAPMAAPYFQGERGRRRPLNGRVPLEAIPGADLWMVGHPAGFLAACDAEQHVTVVELHAKEPRLLSRSCPFVPARALLGERGIWMVDQAVDWIFYWDFVDPAWTQVARRPGKGKVTDLVAGPGDHLWMAVPAEQSILSLAPGAKDLHVWPTQGLQPLSLGADPRGNLLFSVAGKQRLGALITGMPPADPARFREAFGFAHAAATRILQDQQAPAADAAAQAVTEAETQRQALLRAQREAEALAAFQRQAALRAADWEARQAARARGEAKEAAEAKSPEPSGDEAKRTAEGDRPEAPGDGAWQDAAVRRGTRQHPRLNWKHIKERHVEAAAGADRFLAGFRTEKAIEDLVDLAVAAQPEPPRDARGTGRIIYHAFDQEIGELERGGRTRVLAICLNESRTLVLSAFPAPRMR